ncbi:hypothetical protein VNO77_42391 [Canavalia gladiata]|uniref:Xyloglucan endotransglucosylase/hydrolase n=1 Tax=Canavalia gladiata TaxID=3824 RepID=A0AAN9JS78_CANGL
MISDMRSHIFVFLLFLVAHVVLIARGEISFDQNYMVTFGGDHVTFINPGNEIQLSLDNYTGSGFGSKMTYGSGFFHQRIKVPGRNSAGVVTAFYLTSQGPKHDELDFEFLGSVEGKPIILQTNIFTADIGGREQRIHLWFDPTANFHDYAILWNQHQIVFYVDNIPIRVYKNKSNVGVAYPSKPMKIQASLWNGAWSSDTKINWSYAPFKANYQGFDVSGCQVQSANCASVLYWWNGQKYWQLDPIQQRRYEMIKKKYMVVDYCNDKKRYPQPPLECLP